jgi:gamma-glutamyltranspeptidase
MFGLYPSEYNYAGIVQVVYKQFQTVYLYAKFRLGPGKRPFSSITPAIIEKDAKFELAIGGSGGSMIPTATLNVSFCFQKNKQKIITLIFSFAVYH